MKSICLTVGVLLALFLAPATATSAHPCGCWIVDWSAWRATWCAPFALESMQGYYIPRTPACCVSPLYWVGQEEACCFAPDTSDGFEPAEFEHLGQIPNDLLLQDVGTPR